MYYLIYNSEGDTIIAQYDKKEKLLKNIEDNCYGELEFFCGFPSEKDTNYWNGKALIIKGKVVVPEPIQSVTRYDIE